MAITNTSICNQALGVIGALQIDDLESDTSVQAIKCRVFFEPDRDSLLRSHWWRFASARAALVVNAETPAFEWNFQFDLPDDFVRMKSIFEDTSSNVNFRSYALEGNLLLTDQSEMSIKYIKEVTDPTEFDSLFVKVLVYTLADDLIGPLAGGDARIQKKIDTKLAILMPQVRTIDAQETNTDGVVTSGTWNNARFSGRSNDPGVY
jgi:hypothetical protein